MKYKAELIKEDFLKWLEESDIALQDFKDWYAVEYLKIPIGTLRRLINRMNKIADDDRLGPNRRMLAAYQGSYWSAKISGDTNEQAFLGAIILGEFVNRLGFRLADNKANSSNLTLESQQSSKIELAAMKNLQQAFSVMRENLKEEGFLPNESSVVQGEQG